MKELASTHLFLENHHGNPTLMKKIVCAYFFLGCAIYLISAVSADTDAFQQSDSLYIIDELGALSNPFDSPNIEIEETTTRPNNTNDEAIANANVMYDASIR
jgi:hypothetical protein